MKQRLVKILLVQPNTSERTVGFTAMIRTEPLALEILAAMVPEHEVKILDLRIDTTTLEANLSSFQPDLVGVTGYTADVPRMRQICQEVKSCLPATITVVGGYHATLCPHDFDSDYVDVIVVGEGEVAFPELVSALEGRRELSGVDGIIYRRQGKQVTTGVRQQMPDLDDLPLPARHLTEHYRSRYHFHFWDEHATIETSRGCPYRCTFCAVWVFHRGKYRFKAPETVLKEVKAADSPVICFLDDNFLEDVERAERIYQLIKDSGIRAQYWVQARADTIVKYPRLVEQWADIGLDAVFVGFETWNEEVLASYNKGASVSTNEEAARIFRDNGVDIWGAFIVEPQWTKRDFDALIDYVRSLNICFPIFTVLTPIPGTPLFQEKFKELCTLDYEVFDFLHPVLPTRLPIEEFYSEMARLYSSTTMGFRELKQRVREGRIPISSLGRVREVLQDVTNPQAYINNLMQAKTNEDSPGATR